MVPVVIHCNNGDHTNENIKRKLGLILTVLERLTLIWPVSIGGSISA